jgi:hypothetical protein
VEPVEAAPPTPAEDPPPAALPFELRRAGLPEP